MSIFSLPMLVCEEDDDFDIYLWIVLICGRKEQENA